MLDRARELYNAALTERRAAYEAHVKRHPGYYDDETRQRLTRELSADYYGQKRDKELRPEYQEIASHVLQDVILLCFGEPYVWPMIIDYRHGAQKLLVRTPLVGSSQ